MKILYVEDNPANVFLVKRVARMGQHEIINYIDGNQALQKFDEVNPDLVLMDIQLAGDKTGLDVVKELRARGVETAIIAVTAYAMVGDKERCLKAGCTDYLAKPLPIPRLVEIFQHYSDEAFAKAKNKADAPKTEEKVESVAPVESAKAVTTHTEEEVSETITETKDNAKEVIADVTEATTKVEETVTDLISDSDKKVTESISDIKETASEVVTKTEQALSDVENKSNEIISKSDESVTASNSGKIDSQVIDTETPTIASKPDTEVSTGETI
ncbi:MAG: hypothetical protein Phog2KO_10330 [Phototrophicaceae bacterium]